MGQGVILCLCLFLLLWTWESWLFNNYKKISATIFLFFMLSSPSRSAIRQMLDFLFYSPCLFVIFLYQSFWNTFWKFSSNYTSGIDSKKEMNEIFNSYSEFYILCTVFFSTYSIWLCFKSLGRSLKSLVPSSFSRVSFL